MLICKHLIISTIYKLLKIIKLNGLKNNRIKKRWKKDHNEYFLIAVIIKQSQAPVVDDTSSSGARGGAMCVAAPLTFTVIFHQRRKFTH